MFTEMTGTEFYNYLKYFYIKDGQLLFGNYSFRRWIKDSNNEGAFQFNGTTPPKSIPKDWFVDAKNKQNEGAEIDRNWFNENKGCKDCRASVAVWLLSKN